MSRLECFMISAALFLLQSAVLPLLMPGAWQPDLWLVAIVISVLAFDRKTAVTLAAVGGLLQDIVTGNFFGLHLLPYAAVVFLISLSMRERYNRKWLVSVLSAAAGTAISFPFVWLVIVLAGGRVEPASYLLHAGLPQILLNSLAAVFLHHILWNMKHEWEPKW